jgi:hypothetical protein
MPVMDPPISESVEEDSWKQSATFTIRQLEYYIEYLENRITELEARVTALE